MHIISHPLGNSNDGKFTPVQLTFIWVTIRRIHLMYKNYYLKHNQLWQETDTPFTRYNRLYN